LNRGWIDRTTKRIPTYKEVTHAEDADKEEDEQKPRVDEEMLEDDEEFEEIAETFETSYNFRFEEPCVVYIISISVSLTICYRDAATIQTHPRNIESAVRRKDTTRKDARERRKQRKEEELQKKKEEVRRMKALKMKELREKLEKIEKEGGLSIDPEGEYTLDMFAVYLTFE